MPPLAQSLGPLNPSQFQPVAPSAAPALEMPGKEYPLNPNPFLRCPLPPVNVTPDSLRQFYQAGLVPQTRIMTPPATSTSGSGGTSITNILSSSTATTSAKSSTSLPLSASITTPTLTPTQSYLGMIALSAAFVIQVVSVTAPARVQLYATKARQASDIARAANVSVAPGTSHGLIFDVNLDAGALSWELSPDAPGSNGDNPQKAFGYITVTNTGPGSAAITATLQFTAI